MRDSVLQFKKILVIFWTIWWLIALWTDVVGGLAHLGYIKASWAPDLNYPFLVKSLQMYPEMIRSASYLLIGILLWSTLSTASFLVVCWHLRQPKSQWLPKLNRAMVISLSFWLAFFLADQLVMKFDLEENHMVQGAFQLLTFFAFYLLPDSEDKAD